MADGMGKVANTDMDGDERNYTSVIKRKRGKRSIRRDDMERTEGRRHGRGNLQNSDMDGDERDYRYVIKRGSEGEKEELPGETTWNGRTGEDTIG